MFSGHVVTTCLQKGLSKHSVEMTDPKPEISRAGALYVQVCVPAAYTDDEITAFANANHPCGTTNGWVIRKQDDPALAGAPERMPCTGREGCVHVMLDC